MHDGAESPAGQLRQRDMSAFLRRATPKTCIVRR